MHTSFQAIQISPSVYRVGAIDWALRNFHGYETRRGSTYNAFLVKGTSGYALIDTVKKGFADELLARTKSVCDPRQLVAIISNHAEMDHSGNIPYVLERIAPDAKVYASVMGAKALAAHFGADFHAIPVAPSSTLEIAGRKFHFVETRMLHWPDSMWTFDVEERVLFSNDAFGMHLAGLPCWYDEYDPAILEEESSKYFANILMTYASYAPTTVHSGAAMASHTSSDAMLVGAIPSTAKTKPSSSTIRCGTRPKKWPMPSQMASTPETSKPSSCPSRALTAAMSPANYSILKLSSSDHPRSTKA